MKRVRAVLAVAAVSLVCFLHAACYDETALENAHALYDVDLIKGSSGVFSAEGMELDRVATRAEMAVTVTRMLGKEAKAVYQHNSHPFTDVPDWAGDCVGWLYENYLVNGVSETAFGAYENASLTQFCAMMLRVLGYSDVKGDFSYEQAVPFALSVGLADESMLQKQLLERGDMVKICYRSLFLPLKRARRLLYEKLEDEKVLTQDDIERLGGMQKDALYAQFPDLPKEIPPFMAERTANGEVVLFWDEPVASFGLRLYYACDEQPLVTEITENTYPVFRSKGRLSYISKAEAGFINEITVTGLASAHNIRLIAVSSTGYSELSRFTASSDIVSVPDTVADSGSLMMLERVFDSFSETLPAFDVINERGVLRLSFDGFLPFYGVRLFYTADDAMTPQEITLYTTDVAMEKGETVYDPVSGLGYISEIYVKGLASKKHVRLMAALTSSEGQIYFIQSRSAVVSV